MVKVDMTHSITCQHCIDLIHVPEDIMFIRHSGRHKWIGKEIIYTYLCIIRLLFSLHVAPRTLCKSFR